MLTNGKGLPPLSEEKLAAQQAKRKAGPKHTNFDGEYNPKRVRGDYQAQDQSIVQNAFQNYNTNVQMPYAAQNWPQQQQLQQQHQQPVAIPEYGNEMMQSSVCLLLYKKARKIKN